MKNNFSKTVLILVAILTFSCSNDDNNSNPNPNPNPTTGLFRYSENAPLDISTDIKTLDVALFTTQFNTLVASNANGTVFEINLTASTIGAYTVNANNVITYTTPNPYFVTTSGEINITANANNKISGNFIGLGSGSAGTVTRVYGEFNDVPVQ